MCEISAQAAGQWETRDAETELQYFLLPLVKVFYSTKEEAKKELAFIVNKKSCKGICN